MISAVVSWVMAAALGASTTAGPDMAGPDMLVSTQWVADHGKDAKVRVVEVSVDPGAYEKGHVAGAVAFKWHTELCDPVGRDVVSQANFEALCARSGIARDTTIVFYGDNNNWFACWAVWISSIYGHPSIKVMDGGRTKWELEKRPWDTAVPMYPPATYAASGVDKTLRARLVDVVPIAEKQTPTVLVDVRSPEEYTGKVIAPPGIQELAIRAGRIPGARNVPWKKAVNEDGTFKSVDELKKLYADAGVDGSKPIVCYCRIGERSSHSWFVLKFLLGFKDVRNYDGSWTEWGNAVGVPIENEAGSVWTGK